MIFPKAVLTTSSYYGKTDETKIAQIKNVVTPSGNNGHVVVPKAWIGKEAIVNLKENRAEGKSDVF